jgi:hypothetical protein
LKEQSPLGNSKNLFNYMWYFEVYYLLHMFWSLAGSGNNSRSIRRFIIACRPSYSFPLNNTQSL